MLPGQAYRGVLKTSDGRIRWASRIVSSPARKDTGLCDAGNRREGGCAAYVGHGVDKGAERAGGGGGGWVAGGEEDQGGGRETGGVDVEGCVRCQGEGE